MGFDDTNEARCQVILFNRDNPSWAFNRAAKEDPSFSSHRAMYSASLPAELTAGIYGHNRRSLLRSLLHPSSLPARVRAPASGLQAVCSVALRLL